MSRLTVEEKSKACVYLVNAKKDGFVIVDDVKMVEVAEMCGGRYAHFVKEHNDWVFSGLTDNVYESVEFLDN